ncbi:hypothetical protein IDJ75_08125 [Mucilaginibacter rigui]|uniref:Lipoprotein n=1 Tax=Mucilaginibacter rigui TaxID=534635 RepID=A0ABR7X3T0_9SPHI|nr:hypothetical protein [Mucilaginibacter rigui]MBD1385243.1 hypothetical protein [Mucilaginibacter rigui]
MKPLLFTALVFCCFVITSCSRYQVNVISSTNGTKNQQTGDFEFENDSVKIAYSFYGPNAPVTVNVQNKLNKPLYIDWQKSALIIDGAAVSYAPDKVAITGSINAQTDSYHYNNNPSFSNPGYTTGSINAVAGLPKNTTFLPPHSQSSNTSVRLTKGFLNIPDSVFHKVRMVYKYQDTVSLTKVKSADFSDQSSPLRFKSYLTLYIVNGNEAQPATYQHDFFVSRSLTTTMDPKQFREFSQKRGDYFINSKATGYAKAMAGIGVATAIGAGGAISNSHNNSK